jgi:type IV pilus biogenesis protein CpaD/CtpE
MRTVLLVAMLLALAGCTSASQRAVTDALRDLNQTLIPIGALAGGR